MYLTLILLLFFTFRGVFVLFLTHLLLDDADTALKLEAKPVLHYPALVFLSHANLSSSVRVKL